MARHACKTHESASRYTYANTTIHIYEHIHIYRNINEHAALYTYRCIYVKVCWHDERWDKHKRTPQAHPSLQGDLRVAWPCNGTCLSFTQMRVHSHETKERNNSIGRARAHVEINQWPARLPFNFNTSQAQSTCELQMRWRKSALLRFTHAMDARNWVLGSARVMASRVHLLERYPQGPLAPLLQLSECTQVGSWGWLLLPLTWKWCVVGAECIPIPLLNWKRSPQT